MIIRQKIAIRLAMEALYFSGAHRAMAARCGGLGVIFTLHRVRPARGDAFQPNRFLEITPDFLERVVLRLRRGGLEFVNLDEAHRRLTRADDPARFACLTFDDGYRDNLEWAYPVLKRHRVPFAIFVTPAFADGTGHLWWQTLETAIAENDSITVRIDGHEQGFACATTADKHSAMRAIGDALSAPGDEAKLRAAMADLARRSNIDTDAACASACMTWRELARLAADPLVTIGAHTMTHPKLRTLDADAARYEISASADRIAGELGVRPDHFAFPYGDASAAGEREFGLAAELGFKTALTTRPSVLTGDHRTRLTRLPRISLNGEYQRLRHVTVLASGTATALWQRLRRPQPA